MSISTEDSRFVSTDTFHDLEIIQRDSHQHFVLVRVEQTDQAVRARAPANFNLYRLSFVAIHSR